MLVGREVEHESGTIIELSLHEQELLVESNVIAHTVLFAVLYVMSLSLSLSWT